MAAEARFCCRPNSHPFNERRVVLSDSVKIGRSVAKCRPSTTNAVFDCKVLSRNHAKLWFDNGKFYLQDTKSSNGTFVNNQRLSRTSEESTPMEINSCDIVQFGVDVVDTTKKVTHGCIVSQIRLFLPNGEEAKRNVRTPGSTEKVISNSLIPTIQFEDLYQLQQYLQEAMHREQMLEQKLALLQRCIDDSSEASNKGWSALIDEDKLLTRLEFLENQIQLYKTKDENTLQSKVLSLEEEKHQLENTSKETLCQAVKEKMEAAAKVSNLEFQVGNLEDECTNFRLVQEETKKHVTEISRQHQEKCKQFDQVNSNVKDLEVKCQEAQNKIEILTKEKKEMQEKYELNNKQLTMELCLAKSEFEELQGSIKSRLESLEDAETQVEEDELQNHENLSNTPDSKDALLSKAMKNLDELFTCIPESEREEVFETICGECKKKFTVKPSESATQNLLNESLINLKNHTNEIEEVTLQASAAPLDKLPHFENGQVETAAENSQESRPPSFTSNEKLIAEESRLKQLQMETERQLSIIRCQLSESQQPSKSPETQQEISSSSTDLPQQQSSTSASTGHLSKSKSLRKSSSLMLKSLPSVFGGKRSSKKKAVLSESDCSEVSNVVEIEELHKEIAILKSTVETRNNSNKKLSDQIVKYEEDLKDAENQVKHLLIEQKENENLRQEVEKFKLHIADSEEKSKQCYEEYNKKFSDLEDKLKEKESEVRLSLETGEKLRQQVAACEDKIKSLQDQCNSEAESFSRLTECKNKIEEEKKLLEEQLDGLKDVQKRNEDLIESAQQQSQMLAKKPTEEKRRYITMILVAIVSIVTGYVYRLLQF